MQARNALAPSGIWNMQRLWVIFSLLSWYLKNLIPKLKCVTLQILRNKCNKMQRGYLKSLPGAADPQSCHLPDSPSLSAGRAEGIQAPSLSPPPLGQKYSQGCCMKKRQLTKIQSAHSIRGTLPKIVVSNSKSLTWGREGEHYISGARLHRARLGCILGFPTSAPRLGSCRWSHPSAAPSQ